MNSYCLTTPCPKCPFRNDIPAYLTFDRAMEIGGSEGEFHCHLTTDSDDETGEGISTPSSKVCAGFLILREKMGQPNQMMRIAERLGMYEAPKLDMNAPVYEDVYEMAEAQPR